MKKEDDMNAVTGDIEESIVGSKIPLLEKIIYDFQTDVRRYLHVDTIEFLKAVEIFYLAFPYRTKNAEIRMRRLETWYSRQKQAKSLDQRHMGEIDIHYQYGLKKFSIIVEMLKDKNLYPKPAEVSVYE